MRPNTKRLEDLMHNIEQLAERLAALAPLPGIDSAQLSVARFAIENVLSKEFTPWTREVLKTPFKIPDWSKDLNPDKIKIYELLIEAANMKLAQVLKLFLPFLEAVLAFPPPFEYAKASVWGEWQAKENAILCLRPPGKRGLPLSVFHDVFREFQLQVNKALPQTDEGASFLESAFKLCSVMGNRFESENERSAAFQECVQPYFTWESKERSVFTTSELCSDLVDVHLMEESVVTIIREDKIELGDGNDAYMQASRAYQLYVSSLQDGKSPLLEHGAPTFLLTIQGPMLLVSGGFYDGKSTIVEPLTHPCLMLPDYSHKRQEDLARQLFALRQGITIIAGLASQKGPMLPPFTPATPRIYQSFTRPSGIEELGLRFVAPLEHHPLMFLASTTGNASDSPNILVKLVIGGYGEKVHQILASSGFAPAFYGTKRIEGAPTAIVMECLQPPLIDRQGTPGWLTLSDFTKHEGSAQHKGSIRIALDNLLGALRENWMVHGDIRSNNVMLKVDSACAPCMDEGGHVYLKVVDFDWAGTSGEVRYPIRRNESIAWPAGRGERILVGHDRQQVELWWSKLHWHQ
ncbi:hypothetical protein FRB99_004916 [Tulasnella sp. 403]|nr:hypothetical protein FRB99_004916 [Tulasnella sp. 403]